MTDFVILQIEDQNGIGTHKAFDSTYWTYESLFPLRETLLERDAHRIKMYCLLKTSIFILSVKKLGYLLG